MTPGDRGNRVSGTRILRIPPESFESRGDGGLQMEVLEGRHGSPLGRCIDAASDEAKLPREEVQGARVAARAAVDIAEPATKVYPDYAPHLRCGPKHA